MLGQLIKAFVITNLVGGGAKEVFGADNPITKSIDFGKSFLSDFNLSGGSGGGGFDMAAFDKATEVDPMFSVTASRANQLQSTSASSPKFPGMANERIAAALLDPRIDRLLKDISIGSIDNRTITLNDFGKNIAEDTIEVNTKQAIPLKRDSLFT
jgi:hypothetical protein|tara:strand:+ start:1024 stop:1488 length:465 start_codon:yes stop_codon:yes gene_type:complete